VRFGFPESLDSTRHMRVRILLPGFSQTQRPLLSASAKIGASSNQQIQHLPRLEQAPSAPATIGASNKVNPTCMVIRRQHVPGDKQPQLTTAQTPRHMRPYYLHSGPARPSSLPATLPASGPAPPHPNNGPSTPSDSPRRPALQCDSDTPPGSDWDPPVGDPATAQAT